jgi:protein-export membrane protein SecD
MLFFQPWKTWTVIIICLLGVLLAAPNLIGSAALDRLPSWVPKRQIALGLDLQGGSHLLLEADLGLVIKERLTGDLDILRSQMIKDKIGYTSLAVEGDKLAITLRDPGDLDRVKGLVKALDADLGVTAQPNGVVTVQYDPQAITKLTSQTIAQSIEVVRRRVDALGTREPTIAREGADRILVQVPGYDDPERLKKLIGQTAKMTFHLVDEQGDLAAAMQGHVPPGDELLPLAEQGNAPRPGQLPNYLIKKRVMVDGADLVDAQPTFQDSSPVISFKFDAHGAHLFGEATQENVGKLFAIVLDDKVISAPVIKGAILGGSGVIEGGFTVQSADDLAKLLRAGALPAKLTIIEERTVGPDLGADSIHAGATASLIAVTLVAAFMVLFYGLFGIFADIALFFNLAIMLAALSVLGATLTLPGIAGIALTMGMAVDANVLVNERIREEARLGRTMISAIDAGFSKAYATIIDANVTHLIAGVFLFWLGSGPVKGFAVTLCVGILTSLFTTVMVSRLFVVWWLRRRPKMLPI